MVSMLVTEQFELLIRNLKFPRIPQGLVRSVLFGNDEYLKTLPALWVYLLDSSVHVFFIVVYIDNSVDFEHDIMSLAHLSELLELLQVLPCATANLDIRLFIEGVTGYGHDIDISAVFGEPSVGDLAAIGDDRHGLKVKRFFAVFGQLTQKLSFQEGFATSEVDLFHPCVFQK